MDQIKTTVYAFTDKDDFNKSKPKQLSDIEFVNNDFRHLSENNFYGTHFKSCFLIKANFFIPDPEDDLQPGRTEARFYLIEPVFEIISDHKTNFLRITLIDSVDHFAKILDYLDFLILDNLHGQNIKPHWTICLEIVIRHFLELEKISQKKVATLEYRAGQYREIILTELKQRHFDENITDKILADLNICLATHILPATYSNRDRDDCEYSKDELDDLYRAAYENDPSNQWNND